MSYENQTANTSQGVRYFAHNECCFPNNELCAADFLPPHIASRYLAIPGSYNIKPATSVKLGASEMDATVEAEHAMAVNQ